MFLHGSFNDGYYGTANVTTGMALFLCVGFLGSFTTFSSFGYETFSLFSAGKSLEALGYVGVSVIVGLVATKVGVYVGLRGI